MLRACELLPGLAFDDLVRLERSDQVTLMTYAWVRANEGAGAAQGMKLDREPKAEDQDGDPAT